MAALGSLLALILISMYILLFKDISSYDTFYDSEIVNLTSFLFQLIISRIIEFGLAQTGLLNLLA